MYGKNPLDKKFRLRRLGYYFDCAVKITREMSVGLSGIVKVKKPDLKYKIVSWTDLLVIKEVVVDGDYEKYGVLPSVKDKVIVDIGAAFGDWTIMTAKRFPRAVVYAFEPEQKYFAALAENCGLNKVNNVKLINKAVVSMEGLGKEVGFEIDHLKCDCEGCEFEIFKDKDGSKEPIIKKVVMEFHENRQHRIRGLENYFKKRRFGVRIFPQREVPGLGILTAVIKSS